MIDYQAMLDAIYGSLGVPATLVGDSTFELTVIDKTEGVLLEGNGMQLGTAKPAVCIRVAELTENGIARADLKGAMLSFNGNDWIIRSSEPKPKPSGPGELYLFLQASSLPSYTPSLDFSDPRNSQYIVVGP